MRVLAIEDEPGVADVLRRALEDDGFVFDLAENGIDGMWKATENAYDVIVLDIMLPDKNGYLICRELRQSGIDTPILMLTGKHGEYDHAEGLDLGADDYMTKPFSVVVLLARVRALIRRGPSSVPSTLQVDDLLLDPGTRFCRRGDTEIELTRREFSLLRYLMCRPGQTIAKDELLTHVWNDEIEGSDVVRVYIGYLRKKIDGNNQNKLIHTMRGHGYRLGCGRPSPSTFV